MSSHTNKSQATILFTSIGRRVELVRAFKKALENLPFTGEILGTDINPLAPALWEVDFPYIVPRLDHPKYIPELKKICLKHHVKLILPLIDHDIPILAAHRADIESTGAKLGVIPQNRVDVVGDKWETYQFFKSLQIPTPQSWLPHMIQNVEKVCFPLFIKPRHGSASQNTFRVNTQKELNFFTDYVPNPIIQECILGPEITNDLICDLSSNLIGFVSRQRIEVRSGEVNRGVTIFNQGIYDHCQSIARQLPAIGPITVQCLMKGQTPLFTEINARLGGGVPLGIAAGVPSPEMLLRVAANQQVTPPPANQYQTDLYLSRFDDSRFLTKHDKHQMAQNRYSA